MKHGVIALSGLAWFQLAAAACCRSNKCLKVIAAPALGDGIQECSSLLAVTVTPSASTVTETITVVPTEHNTVVNTAVFTETVTTAAATETQLVTLSTTATPSTYTDVVTITQTVLATETELQTVITTLPATTRVVPVKARADIVTEVASSATVPSYASADCPSWKKYVSACKCAGVNPTTVTAEAPSATTVTVTYTASAETISIPATVSTTETVFVSVTATTAATHIITVFVTATVSATESAIVSTTLTVTETVTETVTPSAPTCKVGSEAGSFKAAATDYNNTPLHMYANLLNSLTGGINWQTPSTITAASIQNRFIWALDDQGYLGLARNVPPYNYEYAAYFSAQNGQQTVWPQVNFKATVENAVARRPDVFGRVRGCVNSKTGELTLDAGGRTNILWCGAQMWMSSGGGEDINRGTCVKMFPKVVAAA